MDYDKSIELMLPCISNGFKPFIAPAISLSSVTGQSVLIRTSHPSGSRQLYIKRNAQYTAPGPFVPQKIFSAMQCPIGLLSNLMPICAKGKLLSS
jgi:hypothetical protein